MELIKRAFNVAQSKGFHSVDNPKDHNIVMAISELYEAKEGHRQGKIFKNSPLTIQEVIASSEFKTIFKENVKDSMEDEFADVCIWILDFCGLYTYNLTQPNVNIIFEEMPLNSFIVKMNKLLIKVAENIDNKSLVEDALSLVYYSLCRIDNIPTHIDAKLTYNNLRPKLHGKEY